MGYTYKLANMGATKRISIALLCSVLAMPVVSFLSFYLFLLLDPIAHDGVALMGGLAVGIVAFFGTFMVLAKKK